MEKRRDAPGDDVAFEEKSMLAEVEATSTRRYTAERTLRLWEQQTVPKRMEKGRRL
jgi:hypothetical protein